MQKTDSCDDACISDIDSLINSLSSLKVEEFRPEIISSIITHYASKWLPEIAGESEADFVAYSPESITASRTKKRYFIETLVGILSPDKDIVSCDFLLKILRVANMVGVGESTRAELEERVSWQLDQASLRELMVPSFSHTCATLLDVELVLRLVRRFVELGEGSRAGGALVKVAKLVDCYLAEATVDRHLTLPEFVALASALPSHARSSDDGLYRAIDTYLKVHPGLSKQERKRLCDLIDCRKLSPEACFHAAQNERLPIRAVIQILLSEQTKLHKQIDYSSGSFSGTCSKGNRFESSAWCHSKRQMSLQQQMEIQRLKEDILRLQSQCMNMETQVEELLARKKGSSYFNLKKLFTTNKTGVIEGAHEEAVGLKTPLEMKTGLVRGTTSRKWRKSSS